MKYYEVKSCNEENEVMCTLQIQKDCLGIVLEDSCYDGYRTHISECKYIDDKPQSVDVRGMSVTLGTSIQCIDDARGTIIAIVQHNKHTEDGILFVMLLEEAPTDYIFAVGSCVDILPCEILTVSDEEA